MSTDGAPFERLRLPFVAPAIASLCSSLVPRFSPKAVSTLHRIEAGDQRG
jgi:hypothetical protein